MGTGIVEDREELAQIRHTRRQRNRHWSEQSPVCVCVGGWVCVRSICIQVCVCVCIFSTKVLHYKNTLS